MDKQAQAARPNNFHGISLGILILVPIFMFSTIASLFTFCFHSAEGVVWTTVALFFVLSCLLMIVRTSSSRAPFWFTLGVICMLSVLAGAGFGMFNFHKNIGTFWSYDGQREYTNVLPSEPALSHIDAGKITFSSDAHVLKNASSANNVNFCVAPIIGTAGQSKIQYWAAGVECCKDGVFACDDSDKTDAHAGLVFLGTDDEDLLNNFRQAADVLAQDERYTRAYDALFIQWLADPAKAQLAYFNFGVGFLAGGIAVHAVVAAITALYVHFCTGPQKVKK